MSFAGPTRLRTCGRKTADDEHVLPTDTNAGTRHQISVVLPSLDQAMAESATLLSNQVRNVCIAAVGGLDFNDVSQ